MSPGVRLLALAFPLVLVAACSGATADVASSKEDRNPTDKETRGVATTASSEVPQGAFTGSYGGCSDVFVYRASDDGTQYAVIELEKERLGLAIGSSTTLDLGVVPEGVGVFVDVYGSSLDELPYCTDLRTEQPAVTRWTAEAGTLTIELHADPESTSEHPTYRATLVLETAHFTRPRAGKAIVVPHVVIDDVRVGWLPG